jgi:hypothetical protein
MTTTQPVFVPAVLAPDFDSFAVRQAICGFLGKWGRGSVEFVALATVIAAQTRDKPLFVPSQGVGHV